MPTEKVDPTIRDLYRRFGQNTAQIFCGAYGDHISEENL